MPEQYYDRLKESLTEKHVDCDVKHAEAQLMITKKSLQRKINGKHELTNNLSDQGVEDGCWGLEYFIRSSDIDTWLKDFLAHSDDLFAGVVEVDELVPDPALY